MQRTSKFVATAVLLACLPHAAMASGMICQKALAAGSQFETPRPEPIVRTIDIRNGDVFNTDADGQDRFWHRLLNAMHMQTRAEIIEHQLLLQPGDTYSPSLADESARMLRDNKYLASAEVVPTECSADSVDVAVITTDSWSLTPSISFSQSGGATSGGFRLEESNLFGRGAELKVGYKSGLDRDSASIDYVDNQIGRSRVGISLMYADNSDGSARGLELAQPFYALDATRAGGVRLVNRDEVDNVYELGEVTDEFAHSSRRVEAFYGWSSRLRNDRVRRWTIGLANSEQRFAATPDTINTARLPVDRQEIYPFVGVDRLEDRYEVAKNINQIHITEDWYLGARLSARFGRALRAFGSTQDTWIAELSARKGFQPGDKEMLIATSGISGRWPDGGPASYLAHADGQFFHRHSEKLLFAANLRFASGRNLDHDDLLVLGGDSGLRGFPARYQNGEASALLVLEERYFTDWYPFHLFRVGAALFVDAGRVWRRRDSSDEPDLGLLSDAGFGLRIGSPHSSSGRMLHIDLAWPLSGPPDVSGPQFFIQTSKKF